MSTSKKRKKAREWMHKEAELRKKLEARAVERGREEMRRDGRALLPARDRTYYNAEGGQDLVEVIKQFPSPYSGMPVFRVPLPQPSSLSPFRYHMNRVSLPVEYLNFRPVEHAFTVRDGVNSASLRWFTWEPDRGNDEIEGHTKALFNGMGKLAFASECVKQIAYTAGPTACAECGLRQPSPGYSELVRVGEILTECFDELRRRLGKFAPIPDISTKEALYRCGYGRTG